MYIKCSKCGKEYNNVPFDKAKLYRQSKCMSCGHVDEIPVVQFPITVSNEDEWNKYETWLTEQEITDWLYLHQWKPKGKIINRNGEMDREQEADMNEILASIRRILSEDTTRTFVFFNKDDAMYFKMVWK